MINRKEIVGGVTVSFCPPAVINSFLDFKHT